MLQVIVIALFLGGAMLAAGEKSQMCRDFVDSAYAVIEQLMAFIISLSPIGVFTYMAWVTATQGASILGSLALVLLCAYVGYFLHAIIVYSFSAKAFAGLSPVAFFKGAVPAMIFAFTSASSTATLPVSKECADNMGADKDISSFVLPLGATVHMDGTAIYMCVATVFLATCAGVQLTLTQLIMVVAIATLSAIGTAGTPGAGVIMLTMVLGTVGIPVDYIGLIIAVDRLFDMGRTTMNITGDIAGALCVTKWTNGKLSNNK
jgi:Na+/H+-dicarboxylate symporter